jgi:D-3-phosphoglycerate dehydrogenase
MNVIGFDPEITVDAAWSLPSQVKKAHSLDELLRVSDFVSLHVPQIPATKHLLNRERLALMRHNAIVLNFSREAIVDVDAIIEAIGGKKLKGYVCDFPDARFRGQPGIIALPHLGASTREAEENCAVMVVDQVRDYLEHGNVRNAVNFPDVVMPRESPFRVGIANANVPNMLGQISTAMANGGLNIHNMLNKSRGEMAYTLVDVDSAVNDTVLAELGAIGGVLSVRYLPAEG